MSKALNKFEIPIEKFAISHYDDKIENDLELLENVSEVIIRDEPEEKKIITDVKEDIKDIETIVKNELCNKLWDRLDGPTN